jgi:uncharacterized protein (DUF302 family)
LKLRRLLCAALIALSVAACTKEPRELRETTNKSFQAVIEELDFAITEHNFRITGRNVIGEAIRKRGHPGFPLVEVVHFCNLEYARKFIELDPHFILEMPCRIAVYQDHGKVVLATMLLPENSADPRLNDLARKVNGILRDIVGFVVEKDTVEQN